MGGIKAVIFDVLLPSSVKLLDGTQLIKQLLVDQTGNLQELVVGDKHIHDLPIQSFSLEHKRRVRQKM